MSKSKYPKQIDTSIELPVVRDNIMQIGSEAINSLRSAIIQIEKTLGTDPNGIDTQTVSDRLSKSLDELGNLKKEAISALNLISGPILNKDVADNARIHESKLDLNYSTDILYSQAIALKADIESIIGSINDLALTLSIHLNKDAVNAHFAKNIGVETITENGSDTSALTLELQNIQQILDQIINKHIGYSGANISATNNSHSADQIFYDNINSGIAASSVQTAIDALTGTSSDFGIEIKDAFFDNNYLKAGKLGVGSFSGRVLDASVSATYSAYNSASDASTTSISYTTALDLTPDKFDILRIGDVNYQIKSVDTVNKILIVYGTFAQSSVGSLTSRVLENPHQPASDAGFKFGVLYEPNLSFSKIIKVVNPNSTFIISDVVYPEKLIPTSKFTVEIDTVTQYEFLTYDTSGNTIDSIINRITEQISANNLPLTAFRHDTEEGSRIGLAIDYVNTETKVFFIKLTSSDNTLDYLGLSAYKDINTYGNYGSKFVINGKEYLDLEQKLNVDGLTIAAGNNIVTAGGTGTNFLELGIKKNDLLTIYGSGNDDGTYIVSAVVADQIDVLFRTGDSFAAEGTTTTNFKIYKNSIGLDSITYDNITSGEFESSIIEVFMDEDRNIFYNNVVEIGNFLTGSVPYYSIIDCSEELNDKTYSISITAVDYDGDGTDDSLNINVDGIDNAILLSNGSVERTVRADDNKLFRFYIPNISSLISYLSTNTISTNFYTKKNITNQNNLILGRVRYDKFRGLIAGKGVSFLKLNPVKRGSISKNEISDDFMKNEIIRPRDETRSNGVIEGLSISNVATASNGNYSFTVNSGVCYIKGKRFEIPTQNIINAITVAPSTNKIFIAIDQMGNIVSASSLSGICDCPFDPENFLVLSTLEYNGISIFEIDLRLFINDLDLKILNEVTVSPHKGMGHFDNINKAINYVKRFSQFFVGAGTPKIILKSGTHRITVTHSAIAKANYLTQAAFTNIASEGIWIDFPVIIQGEGPGTILDLTNKWSDTLSSDKTTELKNRGGIYVCGNALTTSLPTFASASALNGGNVEIKDLVLRNSRVYVINNIAYDSSATQDKEERIIFNNVYFESSSSNYDQEALTIARVDSALSTDYWGGISCNGCTFLESGITIQDANATRYHQRSLEMVNNYSKVTGGSSYLIYFSEDTYTTSNDDFRSKYLPTVSFKNNSSDGHSRLFGHPSFTVTDSNTTNNYFPDIGTKLHVGEDARVAGSLIVGGNASFNNTFTSGNAYFFDDVFLQNTADLSISSGNLSISSGNLSVANGTTSLNGTVDFNNNPAVNISTTIGTIDSIVVNNLTVGSSHTGICNFSKSAAVRVAQASSSLPFSAVDFSMANVNVSTTFSNVISNVNEGHVFVTPYDSSIKKIKLKNMDNDSVAGFLRIYTMNSGNNPNASGFYNLQATYTYILGPYLGNTISVSGVSVSSSQHAVIILETSTPPSTTINLAVDIVYSSEVS